jgi:putative endopeptidase
MFDVGAIDTSVNPCDDFYQYACGNWRKANPIPRDQTSWDRFGELADRTRWLAYDLLADAAKPSPSRTPLQQKYGDFFAACMDVERVNARGIQPILPLLKRINHLEKRSQIAALVADLQSKYATDVLFGFGSTQDAKNAKQQIAELTQGGLGLPDRDFYLSDDARAKEIRQQYVEHVTKMFLLAGDPPSEAVKEAAGVMAFETDLARASQPLVDVHNPAKTYHPLSVVQLRELAPEFDWGRFFQVSGAPKLGDKINIESPDFIERIDDDMKNADLAVWHGYLRWHVIHAAAPWLSDGFAKENFHFYAQFLAGQEEQKPRWRRCTSLTNEMLGQTIGQDWVKRNFPGGSKLKVQKLVASLEAALDEDIRQLDWMGAATKAEARKKLATVREEIGYPDVWRDYSSVKIMRGNLIADIAQASAFEYHRKLMRIGKPAETNEWDHNAQTVDGYYDPSKNEITFPAGILQPPFFSGSANIAQNLGGIGVVIGHEITHGFDNNGNQYDAQGNLREWFTPEDRRAFEQRTSCLVNEYGTFEPVAGQKLDGKLTLSENTADNGALRIAYSALMDTLRKDLNAAQEESGFTPAQQYFISFGQIFCENVTDTRARLAAITDSHSAGQFRVNGAVQNFDEFGKAFHCKLGDPMMPRDSCGVW